MGVVMAEEMGELMAELMTINAMREWVNKSLRE